MANKHTRDFGLRHGGAGKGDAPRTNQGSPEWQKNFGEAGLNFTELDKVSQERFLRHEGYVQNAFGRWTKKFC
jgi:hypothetical protein